MKSNSTSLLKFYFLKYLPWSRLKEKKMETVLQIINIEQSINLVKLTKTYVKFEHNIYKGLFT